MWFIRIYQMWILSRNDTVYGNAWELDLEYLSTEIMAYRHNAYVNLIIYSVN